MRALRIAGLVVGAALLVGELWRGWGAGIALFDWLANPIAGVLLIAASVMLSKDRTRRRAAFVASWALIVGLNYHALVTRISAPEAMSAGNLTTGQLTLVTGLVFGISLVCTVAAILHPRVRS